MGSGATSDEKLAFIEDEIKNIDGDLCEIGVWKGYTFHRIAKMAARRNCMAHAFDSFQGMNDPSPEHDSDHYPKGKFNVGGVENFSKLMDVQGAVQASYRLWPGYIPDCYEGAGDLRFAFVYLDVDVYQPTVDSLAWLWPRLAPGGLLMLDDFIGSRDFEATKAIKEWLPTQEHEQLQLENSQLLLRKK